MRVPTLHAELAPHSRTVGAPPFESCVNVSNTSPSRRAWLNCEQCAAEWQPPDLQRELKHATSSEPAAALQETLARLRARQTAEPRKKLAWFICLTKPHEANHSHLTRRLQREMSNHARVAVLSALLNAPSLVPHVVYMHHAHQRFEADDLTRWLQALGVRMLYHRLSFADDLYSTTANATTGLLKRGPPGIDIGTYCRMDVPFVARRLAVEENWAARRVDSERVLYTDSDVLWAHDAAELVESVRPRTFAMGTEVFNKQSANAGVTVLNVSAMIEEWPLMLRFARERSFHFWEVDQSWIVEWFTPFYAKLPKPRAAYWRSVKHLTGWQQLSDAKWNARGFHHPAKVDGSALVEPHLWHWHGYKARDVECWLHHLSGDGQPCGKEAADGSCTPISLSNGSVRHLMHMRGCVRRQPIVYAWGTCAFRVYLYLLNEHRRLLLLADAAYSPAHPPAPIPHSRAIHVR